MLAIDLGAWRARSRELFPGVAASLTVGLQLPIWLSITPPPALLLGMKTRLQELVQVWLVIGCLKFSV